MSKRNMYGDPYAKEVAAVLVILWVIGSKVITPICSRLFSFLTTTGTGFESLGANVPSPA